MNPFAEKVRDEVQKFNDADDITYTMFFEAITKLLGEQDECMPSNVETPNEYALYILTIFDIDVSCAEFAVSELKKLQS